VTGTTAQSWSGLHLEGQPSSVGEARRFVRRHATQLGADEDAQDRVTLLVSELVTNAVLHARTVVLLGLADLGDCLRVTVTDGSPAMPRRRHFGALETTGRGLQMLNALAADHGVDSDDRVASGGKTVWFTVQKRIVSGRPGAGTASGGSVSA
jgi:anti-sigma regulatory factor (Ser/Thr protein kinase)